MQWQPDVRGFYRLVLGDISGDYPGKGKTNFERGPASIPTSGHQNAKKNRKQWQPRLTGKRNGGREKGRPDHVARKWPSVGKRGQEWGGAD